MKKNVPDDQRIQIILDLICALDGRIMKVERDGDLLIVYANIQSYDEGEEEYAENEQLDVAAYDEEPGEEEDEFEDDYSDYAECYHTCENYKAVNETDWRCVNFCTRCHSCMQDAA